VISRKNLWPAVTIGVLLVATAIQLRLQGRLWSCSCANLVWTSDAWSSLTSQLLFDPYTFTHVLHGVMFAGLIFLLWRRITLEWALVTAIAIECAWEIIENTNAVIDRYRTATAALGYQGDSVMNSFGDIIACGAGFMLAARLGWRWSLVLFFGVEAVLLLWLRDSLLLEILMLVYPIGAIKDWQMAR
jgi:hypothetical protein